MWSAPTVFGPRSLHSFTCFHPAATAWAFCSCNVERWPFFHQGPGVSWTSQLLAGSPRLRSKFSLPMGATWVASQKTLLETNGSHERCTICFACFIQFIRLRPAMLGFEDSSLVLLPRQPDSLRPENAMRSPPSRRLRFRKRFAPNRT